MVSVIIQLLPKSVLLKTLRELPTIQQCVSSTTDTFRNRGNEPPKGIFASIQFIPPLVVLKRFPVADIIPVFASLKYISHKVPQNIYVESSVCPPFVVFKIFSPVPANHPVFSF